MDGNFVKNGYTDYSATTMAKIKPKIQILDGKVVLDKHPREDGIKAAIEYLMYKRYKHKSKLFEYKYIKTGLGLIVGIILLWSFAVLLFTI